jgi:AraC-like DNA-binding protein
LQERKPDSSQESIELKKIDYHASTAGFEIIAGSRAEYLQLSISRYQKSSDIISLVVNGCVETDSGLATSGMLMFHPANVPFFEKSSGYGLHEWVEFKCAYWPIAVPPMVIPINDLSAYRHYFQNLLSDRQGLLRASDFLGLIGTVLASVPSTFNGDENRRFRAVVDFINHHYADSITRNDLAKIASMHPNSLDRAFRMVYRIPPMTMLRNVRLEMAKERLRTSEQTLDEIAIQTGFESSAYFCRVFRLTMSQTPTEWRNSVKSVTESYYRA